MGRSKGYPKRYHAGRLEVNMIGWIYKQEPIMFNRLVSRLAALPTWTRLMSFNKPQKKNQAEIDWGNVVVILQIHHVQSISERTFDQEATLFSMIMGWCMEPSIESYMKIDILKVIISQKLIPLTGSNWHK